MIDIAVPALDGVGEGEELPAAWNRAFPLLCRFLIVRRITLSVDMCFPCDVGVFFGDQTDSFGTEWADDNGDVLLVGTWTIVLSIASMI